MHRKVWLAARPRLLRASIPVAVCLPVLVTLVAVQPPALRGLADPLTPPVPPTYVPTPITPPPGPPTPLATVAPTAATGDSTATVTASATPSGTGASFSLDAVRLSKIHNSGDLKGLIAVRPGTTVWLMIYYTLKNVAVGAAEVRTYQIQYRGKPIFTVTYKEKVTSNQQRRVVRYTTYTVAKSLPFGSYVYRATLRVGSATQTRQWKYSISRQERQTKG